MKIRPVGGELFHADRKTDRIADRRSESVLLTMHLSITSANYQLDAQILIHLLQSSTCTYFEQYLAHPQEVKLY
jgi:hypothetical protein